MENDEALGVRSRVQAIQPRVSRENWALETRGYNAKY